MADNVILSTNVGTGATVRTYEDAGGVQHPGGVTEFLTTLGTPDVAVPVTPTTGLPVRLADGSGYLATLPVSLASVPSHAVTNVGTFAVQVDGAALTSLQLLDDAVGTTGAAKGTRGLLAHAVNPDGDLAELHTDDAGFLYVVQQGIVTVNGTGTFAVQAAQSGAWTVAATQSGVWSVTDGGGSLTVDGSVSVSGLVPGTSATSLGKAEDAVAADGDTGVAVWAVRKDVAATTVGADGDYHPFEVDGNGRLWVNGSSVTQPISAASLPLPSGASTEATLSTLNGKVTACNTGAVTISAALPAGTNAIGKLAANAGVTIGAVELVAAQTLAAVTTVSTVTTCSTVSALTGGGVAHDGADSGNPHKVGAKAETSLSGVTLVADGDRTDLYAGVDGVLITRPHCNLEDVVSGQATNTDGTSTQCIAAQAAGVKTYLTTIILANSHATTNCTVDIKDGTTVKLTIPVPANGGAVVNLPVPLPGTAATAWNFDPSAAVTTISCSMVGFKSKV